MCDGWQSQSPLLWMPMVCQLAKSANEEHNRDHAQYAAWQSCQVSPLQWDARVRELRYIRWLRLASFNFQSCGFR